VPRIVVGAVIVESGHVLAARRTRPAALAGFWEFPGGKVEPGETPRDALTREVHEELSVSIAVADEITDSHAPWHISEKYALKLFLASVIRGEPQPGADHDLLRWLAPEELESVDWLPSDRQAIPAVRSALNSRPQEKDG
jgi:8-oxo-dGTP diphosphatase